MSAADTLTAAAAKLRALAAEATPGPWTLIKRHHRGTGVLAQAEIHRPPLQGSNIPQKQLVNPTLAPDAELTATMHPGVAVALADLLQLHADVIAARTIADGHSEYAVDLGGEHALAVARSILGEEAQR